LTAFGFYLYFNIAKLGWRCPTIGGGVILIIFHWN